MSKYGFGCRFQCHKILEFSINLRARLQNVVGNLSIQCNFIMYKHILEDELFKIST